ncbi:thioredoxin domain-containing protein [Cardiosporidium cionae]|uniref:Thioredoxin domain-containing protein n=1 Tax=Cardiosporidium cionae TaxID=476202 RepID=A0ABQ7J7J3_9APIC|nr:thioredoxin domain-containing protein [Cardiosporidium cionae]|eukprot:KAF8819956.1 thioredoxin domain-containing protein [Cardiosporidium cionae]
MSLASCRILSSVLFVFLICNVCMGSIGGVDGAPIELTDSNFDSKTQATSGFTSGKWFVMFFAPWCGHCKNLEPIWDDLAVELKGKFNIAKVDSTANPALSDRFKVQSFPTLIFFADGYMYEYRGPRSIESLISFCKSTYKSSEGEVIPSAPGILDAVGKGFASSKLYPHVQFIRRSPLVFAVACGITVAFGIILGKLLSFCCGGRQESPVGATTFRKIE